MTSHKYKDLFIGDIYESKIDLLEFGFEDCFFNIGTYFGCLDTPVRERIGFCRHDFETHEQAEKELDRLFVNYCKYLREIISMKTEDIKLLHPVKKQLIDLDTGCFISSNPESNFWASNQAEVYYNDFRICEIDLYSYGNMSFEKYIDPQFLFDNKRFYHFTNIDFKRFTKYKEIVSYVVGRFKNFSSILLNYS